MPHHLSILRHAQTHSSQHNTSDKARKLKPEGIAEATQVGKYLQAYPHPIDLIISSDAVRAKTTAELVAGEIHYQVDQIQFDEYIYSGSVHELIRLIEHTPDAVNHILLIGHYPTIVELNNYLSASQKGSMETCELTVLRFEQGWSSLTEGSGVHKVTYHPTY